MTSLIDPFRGGKLGINTIPTEGKAAERPVELRSNPLTETGSGETAQTSSVQITEIGKRMQALEEMVLQASDFDENKVNQIKTSIERGDYQIDANRLAEKIMQQEFGKKSE